jgi:hypothetical protein
MRALLLLLLLPGCLSTGARKAEQERRRAARD